jgi:hypothetical protein
MWQSPARDFESLMDPERQLTACILANAKKILANNGEQIITTTASGGTP